MPAAATGALGAVPSGPPPRTWHSAWAEEEREVTAASYGAVWAVLDFTPQRPGGSCCQSILQRMQPRVREDCAVATHQPAPAPDCSRVGRAHTAEGPG